MGKDAERKRVGEPSPGEEWARTAVYLAAVERAREALLLQLAREDGPPPVCEVCGGPATFVLASFAHGAWGPEVIAKSWRCEVHERHPTADAKKPT